MNSMHHRKCTNPVGDEVGGILAMHDPLTENPLSEVGDEFNQIRSSVICWNNLQQVHIAGRVEEMRTYKAFPIVVRASFRNARMEIPDVLELTSVS